MWCLSLYRIPSADFLCPWWDSPRGTFNCFLQGRLELVGHGAGPCPVISFRSRRGNKGFAHWHDTAKGFLLNDVVSCSDRSSWGGCQMMKARGKYEDNVGDGGNWISSMIGTRVMLYTWTLRSMVSQFHSAKLRPETRSQFSCSAYHAYQSNFKGRQPSNHFAPIPVLFSNSGFRGVDTCLVFRRGLIALSLEI